VSETSNSLDEARERLREQAQASPFLTIEEAAAFARVNPKTLRRAISAGALRAERPGKRLLFLEDDVRAWVMNSPARPPARPGRSERTRRPAPGSVADLREIQRKLTR